MYPIRIFEFTLPVLNSVIFSYFIEGNSSTFSNDKNISRIDEELWYSFLLFINLRIIRVTKKTRISAIFKSSNSPTLTDNMRLSMNECVGWSLPKPVGFSTYSHSLILSYFFQYIGLLL